MKFSDYRIDKTIKNNIESLGWKRPTDIQFKSIPYIMNGEDVLAIAQTGTGKTAAFAIPIINAAISRKRNDGLNGIRCLILVPTRELAIQIAELFHHLESGTNIKTLGLTGGVEQQPQIQQLNQGIDILVSTPGRMFDLIHQGFISLSQTSILVLDEADLMLDKGFHNDIRDVQKHLPKNRQTLFFSATIDEKIKKLAYSLIRSAAIRIQISPKDRVSKNIQHSVAHIKMDDKRFFLERILKQNDSQKFIIFVRTKVRAERVAAAMERVNIETLTIHGDKEQSARSSVMEKFRAGEGRILVATDVSARGIDIPNVDYVVNYDLPDVVENYIHRVGRTGRGTNRGIAVSFCSEEEKPLLKEIEEYLQIPVAVMDMDRELYQQTIDFTEDTSVFDLKALMKEIEEFENRPKKFKKK